MPNVFLSSASKLKGQINKFVLCKFAGTLMGHVSLLLMWGERAQPAGLTPLTGGFLFSCVKTTADGYPSSTSSQNLSVKPLSRALLSLILVLLVGSESVPSDCVEGWDENLYRAHEALQSRKTCCVTMTTGNRELSCHWLQHNSILNRVFNAVILIFTVFFSSLLICLKT